MKYICLVVLLFCCFSCSSVSRNKEVQGVTKIIKHCGVANDKFVLDYISSIQPYFEGFTETNSRDSIVLKTIEVNKDISFHTYKYVPTDHKMYDDEFFNVKGKYMFLKDVVNKMGIDLKYQNPYFNLQRVYTFKNKESSLKRAVILANNRTFYMNKEVSSLFVIDYNDNVTEVRLFYDIGDMF